MSLTGMHVAITWRNDNPATIWNALARKLGRQPTNADASADVKRILREGMVDQAEQGKLRHQRGVLT